MLFWLRRGLRHAQNHFLYLSPRYDWCPRCGRKLKTWDEYHQTVFYHSRGGFLDFCYALCEGCWSDLTPEQRLPHYEFAKKSPEWEDICKAVREGK